MLHIKKADLSSVHVFENQGPTWAFRNWELYDLAISSSKDEPDIHDARVLKSVSLGCTTEFNFDFYERNQTTLVKRKTYLVCIIV